MASSVLTKSSTGVKVTTGKNELVGNPTLADAILDRIIHNAYRVELSGESLRKPRASA